MKTSLICNYGGTAPGIMISAQAVEQSVWLYLLHSVEPAHPWCGLGKTPICSAVMKTGMPTVIAIKKQWSSNQKAQYPTQTHHTSMWNSAYIVQVQSCYSGARSLSYLTYIAFHVNHKPHCTNSSLVSIWTLPFLCTSTVHCASMTSIRKEKAWE